ncbi:MAG: hypothetical protein WD069_00040 [Planctomycetales bacterium]
MIARSPWNDTREEIYEQDGMDYCPSPAEIRAACNEIQKEWSERERWRRAGYVRGAVPRWQPPQVNLQWATARNVDNPDQS